MKYEAVIMVPTMVTFENPGSQVHVKNQATALMNKYPSIKAGEDIYAAKLLGVFSVEGHAPQPLVFDPPPMCA